MAAFFGIEENQAQGFVENGLVCLATVPHGAIDRHGIVGNLRSEDIVFIKHCAPQSSLHIKAVGIVHSDSASEDCYPVEWVWQGEKVIENTDEALPLCGNALYEEHNIVAQRAIIDLLPARYRLSPDGR